MAGMKRSEQHLGTALGEGKKDAGKMQYQQLSQM